MRRIKLRNIIITSFIIAYVMMLAWAIAMERDGMEAVPEIYQENPGMLLRDFQNEKISARDVLQILLLYRQEGMYITMKDADPYRDLFYVHSENHRQIRQQYK